MNNAPTTWCKKSPIEITRGEVGLLPSGVADTKNEAVNQYLNQLRTSNKIAHDAIEYFRFRQGKYSGPRRNTAISFEVGNLVMYKRRTFDKGKVHKLHSIWRGPYSITSIDDNGNCTLDLPKGDRRHPVFATDMLKLYHDNPDNQRITEVPDDTDDDEVQYEIEHLVNHKVINGKDFYLVRWKGYDQDEDTWEPVSNLEETAAEMIAKYHKDL
jgi:hypothetical protein